MMKDVTIFTFDEMKRIKNDIDNIIKTAKIGESGEEDPKNICSWLVEELESFKSQFE